MQKIKNIIFDLGGIFIEIYFSKTEEAFKSLGVLNWSQFYTQSTASALFENLETGKITPEEFYEGFRKESGADLTDEQIKEAWNAMLGPFPLERLQWLQEIGKRYKIYLFSNTNIIHYIAFQKIFRESTGEQNFDDYFIKTHYSHQLGIRKPYASAYKILLQIEKLEPKKHYLLMILLRISKGQTSRSSDNSFAAAKTVLDLDL
jgi:putative hydrolase of the HAD superfamily